ncbi:hypothetical protein [Bradyrhizobium sp. INPA03-11B]
MKLARSFVSALLILAALSSAALRAEAPAKSELKVGFVPGP